jgi:hypothetical protein
MSKSLENHLLKRKCSTDIGWNVIVSAGLVCRLCCPAKMAAEPVSLQAALLAGKEPVSLQAALLAGKEPVSLQAALLAGKEPVSLPYRQLY